MISFTNPFWNTLVHSTTMLTSVYENVKVMTVISFFYHARTSLLLCIYYF